MAPTDKDGNPMPGKFQLHKVDRAGGQERYIKTKEDDAIQ
jgi:hypothetical protein